MSVLLFLNLWIHGAEGWSMKAYDIRKIIAAEMWYYRRSLNITFKDSRTNVSILEQLNTIGELYEKLPYFGHTSRNKSTITKYILREKIEEKNTPLVLPIWRMYDSWPTWPQSGLERKVLEGDASSQPLYRWCCLKVKVKIKVSNWLKTLINN